MSLLNNTKWVALAQVIKVLCQITNLVVLARLIPPNEYGLMAMAGVVVTLGFLFRDMGTSAAIIQKKELTNELKNAVFWLNLVIGIILMIIILLSSNYVSIYFNQPKLTNILILLSFTFPIVSIAAPHLALLERDFQFKKVAIIESMSGLVATFLAIIAAYNNFGVYSLVVQSLLNAFLSSFFIIRFSNWSPELRGYKFIKEIKAIFSFSKNLVAFNFVNYFYRNSDKWILGKMVSASILGSYDLAYKIMLFPLQTLTFVIGRALFPLLSNLQDNKTKFREIFINTSVLIALLCFPLMVCLMVLKKQFIEIVFGQQWSMVIPIIFWLAPVGMLQSIGSSTGVILTALGKTDILFKLGALGSILIFSSFLISYYIGVDVISFTKYYFYANVLNFTIGVYVVCKVIDLNILDYFLSLYKIVIFCLIIYFFGFVFNSCFDESVLSFIFKILILILIYMVLLILFFSKEISDVLKFLKISKVNQK
ncbi:MOP flippase family protein [uncultured Acinetobacter sp.]|uniref:MOP flippase family protein n=1 Tax=uncultured Acinetobacter sp. TaxID=165433 RepID=UPI00258D3105|nr:MOP flippase family protein [uncultured Acinetobacter sp.]